MGAMAKPSAAVLLADKAEFRRVLEGSGVLESPARVGRASAARARKMMEEDGVRPEDNIASREIVRMREE
jgi:hypothetical protein